MAIALCSLADGAEELSLETGLGSDDVGGEGRIAGGGAGDGAGGTADLHGGNAPAAAGGQQVDEPLTLAWTEDGGCGLGWEEDCGAGC